MTAGVNRPKRKVIATMLGKVKKNWRALALAGVVGVGAVGYQGVRYNSAVNHNTLVLKARGVKVPSLWAEKGTGFLRQKTNLPFSTGDVSAMNFVASVASDLVRVEKRKTIYQKDLQRVLDTIKGNRARIDKWGYDTWRDSLYKNSNVDSRTAKKIDLIMRSYWNAPAEVKLVDFVNKHGRR